MIDTHEHNKCRLDVGVFEIIVIHDCFNDEIINTHKESGISSAVFPVCSKTHLSVIGLRPEIYVW